MEPTKPFPDTTFAAVPHADGMAGVGPLRVPRGAVNLRPALWASGGVLALVAGAWVTWTACQDALSGRGAGSSPDHRRLVALMRSERPFEPRLAGGFDHAPCTVTPHGEDRLLPGPGCGQEGLQAATLDRLRRESPGYSSTSDPHARGVWGLFWGQGEPESVAGAVADLRNAASAQPGPERWNDLAAALIVEARLAQEPALLVEALDWVTRILEQEPTYPEALYNRALLLADLGLGLEAREAWQRYLDEEIDPAWRKEAEGRLAASLEPEGAEFLMERLADGDVAAVAPAVARDSEAVRKLALNRLFAVWSAAVARGDLGRAVAQLDLLRLVGSELRSATGDHLVAEAVAAIDRSRQVPTLARAHDGLVEGRRLMGESRYTEAYERLEAARDRFRRAGSPLDGWAEHWLAVCDSSTNRWGRALERVAAVQARGDLAAYPILDARSRWTRGLIELRTGDYEASLATFLAVASLFEGAGEPSLAASGIALSAESYRALGLWRESWRQRVSAWHHLRAKAATAAHNLLIDAAIAADEEGRPRAALAFQSIGVERARRRESASWSIEALVWRAKMFTSLSRDREARLDLEEARSVLPSIEDPELRRRLQARLDESEAEVLLASEPEVARRLLDRALGLYEEVEYLFGFASAVELRAQAHLALGDTANARRDLERSVEVFERPDRQPLSDLFRRDHFERGQDAFEALIALVLADGDEWGGLALAERARLAAVRRSIEPERRLAGAVPASRPVVPTSDGLREWAKGQPASLVFVEYLQLPDRLVVWRLHRGRLRTWQRSFSRQDLGSLVGRMERSLRTHSRRRSFDEAAKTLHDVLLRDTLQDIPGDRIIVVVPDRDLSRVPFAALKARDTDRYLIQDHAVVHALSLVGQPEVSWEEMAGSVIVAVGSGGEAREELPAALIEADEVAALYPGAVVLSGASAGRSQVLHGLTGAAVFQFSGHAVDEPDRPWSSFLVLAGDASTDESRLYARDLLAMDLAQLRVAVLAACSAGAGRRERALPVSGLSLGLLEAGASAVLSALWKVEDERLRPLVVSFHEQIARGRRPAQAYRAMSLQSLSRLEDSPPAFAPLVLIQRAPPVSPADVFPTLHDLELSVGER